MISVERRRINPSSEGSAVLVVNGGSSSIKMALFALDSGLALAKGFAERLGQKDAVISWQIGGVREDTRLAFAEYDTVLQCMLDAVLQHHGAPMIAAVGHRMVHGGERFIQPTVLNTDIMAEIEALSQLAPLHNPTILSWIRRTMALLPSIPHIAVFDTAFHHTMPPHAYIYAVPYHWYREYGVRRYGFHGTNHHYVACEAAKILGRKLNDCQLITVHLGNGCSAAAIRNGVSVDTTMGMTPLEGLVMGTRSGDVDPGMHEYVARQSGDSLETITSAMNRKSGLLGISQKSNDIRILLDAEKAGEQQAGLAIDVFCYRLVKAIAALSVALERLDGVVFTGGIGEHADTIRERACRQLSLLDIQLDGERNRQHGCLSNGYISKDEASVPVLVIAADEERMIARYVCKVLNERI